MRQLREKQGNGIFLGSAVQNTGDDTQRPVGCRSRTVGAPAWPASSEQAQTPACMTATKSSRTFARWDLYLAMRAAIHTWANYSLPTYSRNWRHQNYALLSTKNTRPQPTFCWTKCTPIHCPTAHWLNMRSSCTSTSTTSTYMISYIVRL